MESLLFATAEQQQSLFLALTTRRDIANMLEVPYSRLTFHLYSPAIRLTRYRSFAVKKRNGGVREILAPVSGLKGIQRRLNEVLQNVYSAKPSVHGFTRERSILSNAKAHENRRFVLNVDLKDFFPSINFGRVRGMFMAHPYNRNPAVATMLAQLCCHDNMLPQGAPTSPVVSNMICARLDSQLQRLAGKLKCTYTRYADDMTFSTSLPAFPQQLAHVGMTTDEPIHLGASLVGILKDNGFEVNTSKLRLRHKSLRQEVTGLIVNKFPNIPRKYVGQVRAMLYAWRKFGLEKARQVHFTRFYHKHRAPGRELPAFQDVVRGRIEFIRMVRGCDNWTYRTLFKEYCLLTGKLIPWESIEVFFSYAHEDEDLRNKLAEHLGLLQREKIITAWHDRCINAGEDVDKEIDLHLQQAAIILLLVSSSFIASDYCWDVEMKGALKRHDSGEAVVIPVILRDCDWQSASFARLRATPTDGKAVTGSNWKTLDEAFTIVARDIRNVATRIKSGSLIGDGRSCIEG